VTAARQRGLPRGDQHPDRIAGPLSLDALTYGPEAIMGVLASAGLSALHLVLPVMIAIVVLLVVLVI